ncbi:hypothetical protein chiPu_0032855, partial [Chiloscyllium punctatum]|nr:hypothetical protein [Chiloscyllium punctatum]
KLRRDHQRALADIAGRRLRAQRRAEIVVGIAQHAVQHQHRAGDVGQRIGPVGRKIKRKRRVADGDAPARDLLDRLHVALGLRRRGQRDRCVCCRQGEQRQCRKPAPMMHVQLRCAASPAGSCRVRRRFTREFSESFRIAPHAARRPRLFAARIGRIRRPNRSASSSCR